MLVIAHRGASRAFPENTAEAFAGAVAQGADGVELDVRRTREGFLAVHHDDGLADGRALVDLARADLPTTIPDLATALDVCAPLGMVNIEIKNWPDDRDFDPDAGLADRVVDLLRERGELGRGRYLVSCFHLGTIDRVHALAPDLPTAWLLGLIEDRAAMLEQTAERGHVAVHPHHAFVDQPFVDEAHALGLQVNTWTCDDPARIQELAAMGVDAVVTNVPDIALTALGR